MKFLKKIFFFLMAAVCFVSPAVAKEKLKVAATSTFFADVVRHIGGEHLDVTALAPPRYNAHFYEPTPKDVRTVRAADMIVHWGLDMEAWSEPLLEAAGNARLFRGAAGNVDMSEGVDIIPHSGPLSRSEGDVHLYGNPHYFLDPRNLAVMAKNVAVRLEGADPGGGAEYRKNLEIFLNRLEVKLVEWKAECRTCAGKEIISYHDDTAYLAKFFGMEVKEFVEPKPGVPPTPQHLEFLQSYIREHDVKAIAAATYFPRGALERLKEKTDIPVITIAQNAGEVPGTESVFEFFDYNVKQIAEAVQ